jgi:hypothetical protein
METPSFQVEFYDQQVGEASDNEKAAKLVLILFF